MAKGIALPWKAVDGRLQKKSGETYTDQLVMSALLGADSANPFQDLGLGEWMIFGLNDEMQESEIRTRVEAVFETLERDELARLEDADTAIDFHRDEGDLYMDLEYIDMETKERRELEVPIPPAAEE